MLLIAFLSGFLAKYWDDKKHLSLKSKILAILSFFIFALFILYYKELALAILIGSFIAKKLDTLYLKAFGLGLFIIFVVLLLNNTTINTNSLIIMSIGSILDELEEEELDKHRPFLEFAALLTGINNFLAIILFDIGYALSIEVVNILNKKSINNS